MFCLGSSGVQPHRPSLSFVSCVVWCEESSHMWSKFAPIVSNSSSSSASDIVTGQLRVCTSTRVQVGVQSKHTISSYHRVGEFKFTAAISQAVFAVKFVQSLPAVSANLNARDQELSNGVSGCMSALQMLLLLSPLPHWMHHRHTRYAQAHRSRAGFSPTHTTLDLDIV